MNTNIQSVGKRGQRKTGVAFAAPFPPTSKTRLGNTSTGWSATHRVCSVLGMKRLITQPDITEWTREETGSRKTLRDGPATRCVTHQSRLGIRAETLRNRYRKDAPSDQRLQTAELEWILNNMRRCEYQAARRTGTALHSTSFLTNPIGGIDGVSHAMIETTYRPSPTNINTSTHTSKGGRLLGFLLRQLPLPRLPVGPLFFGGAPLLLHALGLRARLACSAPPIQIRDTLTISEERTSSVHTPALGATFDFLIPGPQTSCNDTRTHADPNGPKPGGLATQTPPYRSKNENG